jgi:hypothetical protein
MPSSLCFFFVVHLALGHRWYRWWKGSPSLRREISKACEAYRRSCREGLELASLGAHLGELCELVTSCYKLLHFLRDAIICYHFLQDVTSCLPILPWYIFTFSDVDASISCTNNCQGILEAWCVGSEGHLHPYSKVPLQDCSKSCFEVVSLLQSTCGSNKTELHAN